MSWRENATDQEIAKGVRLVFDFVGNLYHTYMKTRPTYDRGYEGSHGCICKHFFRLKFGYMNITIYNISSYFFGTWMKTSVDSVIFSKDISMPVGQNSPEADSPDVGDRDLNVQTTGMTDRNNRWKKNVQVTGCVWIRIKPFNLY